MSTPNSILLATIKNDSLGVKKSSAKKRKKVDIREPLTLQEELEASKAEVKHLKNELEESKSKLEEERRGFLAMTQTLLNGNAVIKSNGERDGDIWWTEEALMIADSLSVAGTATRIFVQGNFEYRSRGKGKLGAWVVKGSTPNVKKEEWVNL